jgi:hypothetical protein
MGDAASKCTIGLDGERSVDQLDVAADLVESGEFVRGDRFFHVVCHSVAVRGWALPILRNSRRSPACQRRSR